MQSFPADAEPSAISRPQVSELGFIDQPVIAVLYAITGALMELMGPLFWAALAVLSLQAIAGWNF